MSIYSYSYEIEGGHWVARRQRAPTQGGRQNDEHKLTGWSFHISTPNLNHLIIFRSIRKNVTLRNDLTIFINGSQPALSMAAVKLVWLAG